MCSFDVYLLEAIRSLGDGFYILMKSFSEIGDANNYFLVIVLLMWCVDYRKFSVMSILLPLGSLMTAGLKYGIQMPRPFYISDNIDLIEGYGMPSGHAMSAVVFWGYLSRVFNKKWFTALSVLMIAGISVSRIYRNSHYPSQIAAALLIGGLLLWLCIIFERKISLTVSGLPLLKAWVISAILPLLFIGFTVIVILMGYDGSGLEDIGSVFSSSGLLLGFSVGLYLMKRKGSPSTRVPIWKQLIKILIIVGSFFVVVYANKYASKAYDINIFAGSVAVLIVNYFAAQWFCYYGPVLLSKLKLFRLVSARAESE